MLEKFTTILLDMNNTFMFDADRFDLEEDFSQIYHQLGGTWNSDRVNRLIRLAYEYLDLRYPDPRYQECFPSLEEAFISISANEPIDRHNLNFLIKTFAQYELGQIPPEYARAIVQLSKHFRLGLVIDIWSPKTLWVKALDRCGILSLCEAISFSSDCQQVKPSPQPFLSVLKQMQIDPKEAVFVGDSIRRDLGGATAAGIACILVGGANHPSAIACVPHLLELVRN